MTVRDKDEMDKVSREGGFALPLVIIVVVVGTLTVLPLLGFLSGAVRADKAIRERDTDVLANEAAIVRIVGDLSRGADAIPSSYQCEQPHTGGQPFQTFTLTTSYAVPTVTVNEMTPTVAISSPQATPVPTQQYVDPGISADPRLLSVPADKAYMIRLFNVRSGTLQVNWAYSPAGISRVIVWQGCPVDNVTGQPVAPGLLDTLPRDPPVLDTGNSPATASSVGTDAITVSPGIYSIIFDNTRGNFPKTTAAFAEGGNANTWIYVNAGRDYLITATAGLLTTRAVVRQVPGYVEPPTGGWSTTNPSFVPNQVYTYTWQEELDPIP